MPSCDAIVVLIVDDDASFRSGVAANLLDDGHVVHEYPDPRAVPPADLAGARLLLTDYHMADLDGIAFADAMHRAYPALPIVLVSAYCTIELDAAVAARPFLHFLRKPVDYDDLHTRIHAAVSEA